ncbi:MAG TPA: prolyl oligopeptidase family serine peptidase [Drouetiella sp.]
MQIKALVSLLAISMFGCIPSYASGDAERKFDPIQQMVSSYVNIGKCSYPTLSPDGKTLAFVSNVSGTEQIWTVPIGGGWPNQLTNVEALVGAVWSPVEPKIAFMAGTGTRQLYVVNSDGTGLKQLSAGDNQISNWSRDGLKLYYSSNTIGKSLIPYVQDLHSEKAQPLLTDFESTDGMFVDDVDDSGNLLLTSLWINNNESQLYLLDRRTKTKHQLTDDKVRAVYSGGGINRSTPSFSLAPNEYLFVTNYGRDKQVFAKLTSDAGAFEKYQMHVFPERNGECIGFCVSRDRSVAAVVWRAPEGDSFSLIDLKTNSAFDLPPLPVPTVAEMELSADGSLLAISLAGGSSPQDIWIYHVKENRYEQVTHSEHPGISIDALVKPQVVKFKSKDNFELNALLYEPKVANTHKPFVVCCSSASAFIDPEIQSLLAMGIGVISPKIREPIVGDTKRLINGDALKAEVEDIRATVNFIVSKGVADPKRIGIMGFSHGGADTMVGLTQCPELFAAGEVHGGVVDYVTYLRDSNQHRQKMWGLKIDNDADRLSALKNLSPINEVARIKVPVLVQQGANDAQVPAGQSDELVQALKKQGTPVDYVQYPDEGHWLHKVDNRIKYVTAITKFFDAKLNH